MTTLYYVKRDNMPTICPGDLFTTEMAAKRCCIMNNLLELSKDRIKGLIKEPTEAFSKYITSLCDAYEDAKESDTIPAFKNRLVEIVEKLTETKVENYYEMTQLYTPRNTVVPLKPEDSICSSRAFPPCLECEEEDDDDEEEEEEDEEEDDE